MFRRAGPLAGRKHAYGYAAMGLHMSCISHSRYMPCSNLSFPPNQRLDSGRYILAWLLD